MQPTGPGCVTVNVPAPETVMTAVRAAPRFSLAEYVSVTVQDPLPLDGVRTSHEALDVGRERRDGRLRALLLRALDALERLLVHGA